MKPEELQLTNCWEAYAKASIPEHAPQVQRDAMYEAFLSGCATVVQLQQALEQHAPSSTRAVFKKWGKEVVGELARLGESRQ